MSRTPLFDSLRKYSELNSGYFRIPGHRFERGIPRPFLDFAGRSIFRIDITETPMADDLHKPRHVIADSQRMTAEAFGAGSSFYLVNGTSCGNESMIMAAAGEGETILVPRNAHKSIMAGLIISGAGPVYLQPEYIEDIGIIGVMNPAAVETGLKNNPAAKAVFAVSPSYHGICSNLKGIAAEAHSLDIPLLVDEAHGAHLYFNDRLPSGALVCGADVCAQSLHKTAGALTQSSLLHVGRDTAGEGRIDLGRLDSALRMTMSTSPSYILMSSLELARNDLELHGEELLDRTVSLAEKTRLRICRTTAFRCPDTAELKSLGAFDADPTRLIINCDALDITGYRLKELLWDDFGIDVEMADYRNILLLFSYGNTEREADALCTALAGISADSPQAADGCPAQKTAGRLPPVPEMILSPRRAYYSKTRKVRWEDMTGCVAAEPAAPYPPGIPIVYPGEIISPEIFEYLDQIKREGRHLHGPSDPGLGTIRVCEI